MKSILRVRSLCNHPSWNDINLHTYHLYLVWIDFHWPRFHSHLFKNYKHNLNHLKLGSSKKQQRQPSSPPKISAQATSSRGFASPFAVPLKHHPKENRKEPRHEYLPMVLETQEFSCTTLAKIYLWSIAQWKRMAEISIQVCHYPSQSNFHAKTALAFCFCFVQRSSNEHDIVRWKWASLQEPELWPLHPRRWVYHSIPSKEIDIVTVWAEVQVI